MREKRPNFRKQAEKPFFERMKLRLLLLLCALDPRKVYCVDQTVTVVLFSVCFTY